ncbi:recombinase RecT [Streptococcus hyointestinalis]|uniref:recombinase RecT n=1 Tax=Streptococcus hyointestinalis TaxID=1337 RepID=UPI0013DF2596|nr:recombinase RecT [Streptococcus hyointestinalis]
MANQLQQYNNQTNIDNMSLNAAFDTPVVKQRFESVLKGKEDQFIATLLSVVKNNHMLAKATNSSIMTAAMTAATLDLPVDPNLGLAYIVPYNRSYKDGNSWRKVNEAQFQIGYRGLIQLAQRSGKIKGINADIVYEEEFIRFDKVSGRLELSGDYIDSGEIKGYFAYVELVNGFNKTIFWTKNKVIEHAKKYSKTFDKKTGKFKPGTPWDTEFDAMATKTLLKEIISKYTPMSIEMEKAIREDNEDSTVGSPEIKDVTQEQNDLSDLIGGQDAKAALPENTADDSAAEKPEQEQENPPQDTSYPADEIPSHEDEGNYPKASDGNLFDNLGDMMP